MVASWGEGLFEHLPDAVLITGDDRRCCDANLAASRLLGVPREDIVGRRIDDLAEPMAGFDWEKAWRTFLRHGVQAGVLLIRRADGEVRTVEYRAVASIVPGRHLACMRDITEEQQIDHRLAERNLLRAIVDNAPVGIAVQSSPNLAYEFVNPAGRAMFPELSLRGKTPSEVFPDVPPEMDLSRLTLLDGKLRMVVDKPFPIRRRPDSPPEQAYLTASYVPLRSTTGEVEAVLDIFYETTEQVVARRQLEALAEERAELLRRAQSELEERRRTEHALAAAEEQLRHAQKMEAVGRLAAGIAHDFNNVLSVVLSYASMLMQDLAQADPMRADLEEMKLAAERAVDLTRQLLAFSRQQVLQPRLVDLSEFVERMARVLRRLVGESVAISIIPSRDPVWVNVDVGQIEQVIMNVVVNARDAMADGGHLTVETATVDLGVEYASHHAGVQPGRYALLAISDTGAGMDKETVAHIFEPFFTTKEKGKGTGLGLSTVFGIVKQSQGHLSVCSEPGRGTTFKIYLPRTNEVDVRPSAPQTASPPSLRGSETVLLVEDEDSLRVLARGILSRSGHAVLDAANAGEALLLAERHPGEIHLLLTDLVMPMMSGRELADRLSTIRPDMRVLYMSGYTDNSIGHDGVLDPGVCFLEKPLTPEKLMRKVREVLSAADSAVVH